MRKKDRSHNGFEAAVPAWALHLVCDWESSRARGTTWRRTLKYEAHTAVLFVQCETSPTLVCLFFFSFNSLIWALSGSHLLSPSPAPWQKKGAGTRQRVWAEKEWRCKAKPDSWKKFLLWSKVQIIQVVHTVKGARPRVGVRDIPSLWTSGPGHLELLIIVISPDMPRTLSLSIDWINNICHFLVLLTGKYNKIQIQL